MMNTVEGLNLHEQNDNHSYDEFARLISEIDTEFLKLAPRSRHITVMATGPGNDIFILDRLDRLQPQAEIIGIDLDDDALKIAKNKLQKENILSKGHRVDLIAGNAESIPEIPDASQDLVIGLNFIHMANANKVITEASRILKKGGTLMINSAYEKNGAYPPGTEQMWGWVVLLARMSLKKKGISEFQSPVDLRKHTEQEYINMAIDSNLQPNTFSKVYDLSRDALKAIANYDEFARGAMPGIDVELSAPALVDAVDLMLKKFNTESVPRGWFSMIATK